MYYFMLSSLYISAFGKLPDKETYARSCRSQSSVSSSPSSVNSSSSSDVPFEEQQPLVCAPISSSTSCFSYSVGLHPRVVSPVSSSSSSTSHQYFAAQEEFSELSADAATPSSLVDINKKEPIYLEQRDHTYLNKKQLLYLGAHNVASRLAPGTSVETLAEQKTPKQKTLIEQRELLEEKTLLSEKALLALEKPMCQIVKKTVPENTTVLHEHRYGLNIAEEQKRNIHRDHSYNTSTVPKGRKLSKLRKQIRASTQSSCLDHAYINKADTSV